MWKMINVWLLKYSDFNWKLNFNEIILIQFQIYEF